MLWIAGNEKYNIGNSKIGSFQLHDEKMLSYTYMYILQLPSYEEAFAPPLLLLLYEISWP